MSGLFGSSSPSVEPAPPAPTVDDAEVQGQETADRLKRRRGMASTILAGANQSTTQPATQSSALLGS